MTVSIQTPINSYTFSGSYSFAYAFLVLSAAELRVSVDGVLKTQGIDYTVAGVGNPAGGTVTYLSTLVAGQVVSVYRASLLQRTTDYQTNGDLLASTLNIDFDRLWLALQDSIIDLPSTLRGANKDTLNELPAAAVRKGGYLGFDSVSGQPVILTPVPTNLSAVSNILPDTTLIRNLGSSGQRWANLFVSSADMAALVTGNITVSANLLAVGATSTIGYGAGAGGSVTQITSKSTTVTLNKGTGRIITHNASLAAGASVIFDVADSLVASTDTVTAQVNYDSGTIAGYIAQVIAVYAAGFAVQLTNRTGGALAEAVHIKFTVNKGAFA